MTKVEDVVKTKEHRVSCDGGKGPLGHPLIYMEFGPDDKQLTCPYCSKTFILTK